MRLIHLPIHLSVNATALTKGDEEGVIINLDLRRMQNGQREIHRRGRPFGLILRLCKPYPAWNVSGRDRTCHCG